jgi:rhodanese-related sulfurtransferase
VAAWTATGRTTASTVLAEAGLLRERRAVDIRQRAEYVDGHASAAVNIELGDIPARLDALPDQPYVVMCGHGERAMSAASLIERAGLPAPAVLLGGPAQWSAAQQCHLERGP